MVNLKELLSVISSEQIHGSVDIPVSGLCCDSRQVTPGDVFFALPGSKADGSNYISQACQKGAVAIVAQTGIVAPEVGQACLVMVTNVRQAMAKMAARFYADPGHNIPVIGVTGTNGKTTITYLLESILQEAGYKPAIIGTVAYRLGQQLQYQASHTTPESLELMRILADFRAHGANALIMEVSSHALEQHRVDGLDFTVAIFTNLTPEHLDYHPSIEKYFASKCRLFDELLGQGTAVINADDEFGRRLLQRYPQAISFGRQSQCSLHPHQVSVGRGGIHGVFVAATGSVHIDSAMTGDFNVSNLLAAVAAAQQLGITSESIARGIENAAQVPGRLERVGNRRGVLALVDYAHTGDALEQVLSTLVKLDHCKLYTVVGCGGDRDPGKRPIMAAVAVKYSDLVIFTSDNPRTEDPIQILEQMRRGALVAGGQELNEVDAVAGGRGFVVIPDRRSAIETAARLARAGDLLLVAGKGHEDYQILGTEKIHFDDREELQRALEQFCPNSVGGHADV